jgi:hypothetical protein
VTNQENENGVWELCIEKAPEVEVASCCSSVCGFFTEVLTGGIPSDIFKVDSMIELCAPYFWRWVLV